MSAPTIIGLTGRAGAGKDTAARMISNQHGHLPIAFADPLYYGLSVMLGVSVDRLQDREAKEEPLADYGVSPRQLLQTLGTEWGRELVHPQLWTLVLVKKVAHLVERGVPVIVTDVRFENEADTIREMGGVIVHIKRDGEEIVRSNHVSENRDVWDMADMVLDNNGTLADLANAIAIRWPVGLQANGLH